MDSPHARRPAYDTEHEPLLLFDGSAAPDANGYAHANGHAHTHDAPVSATASPAHLTRSAASSSAAAAAEPQHPSLRYAAAAMDDGALFATAGSGDSQRLRDLERYMRRHPCILDTTNDFLTAYPQAYPLAVCAAMLFAITVTSWAAAEVGLAWYHFVVAYACCGADVLLFVSLVVGDPGFVAQCKCVHTGDHVEHLPPGLILISSAESVAEYCAVCSSCRPDRAHHCRTCRRCVDRMDHHCPWLGVCVGARNLKHFALYCAYTLVLALYGLWVTAEYVFRSQYTAAADTELGAAQRDGWAWFWPCYVLNLAVTCGGVCATAYLLFRVLYVTARGLTGIEFLAKTKPKRNGLNASAARAPFGLAAPAFDSIAPPNGSAGSASSAASRSAADVKAAESATPATASASAASASASARPDSARHYKSYDRGSWYLNFADAFTHHTHTRPVTAASVGRWSWLWWLVPNAADAKAELIAAWDRFSLF